MIELYEIHVHAYGENSRCGIIILLPRAHAQGVKQSVFMSVVIVCTKIASLGDLDTRGTCKANEYVGIGEKLPSVYTSNHSAPATSITDTAFIARPVDHTYLFTIGYITMYIDMCSLHMRITAVV